MLLRRKQELPQSKLRLSSSAADSPPVHDSTSGAEDPVSGWLIAGPLAADGLELQLMALHLDDHVCMCAR